MIDLFIHSTKKPLSWRFFEANSGGRIRTEGLSVSRTALKVAAGLGLEELPEGIASAFGGTIRGQDSRHSPHTENQS